MKAVEFCYWLQGYFEIAQGNTVSKESKYLMSQSQIEMIHKHLQLVFKHEIDPSYPNQEELNKIHNEGKTTTDKPKHLQQLPPYSGETLVRC